MPTLQLGIDLGGTKIELIGLDETGKTLLRRRSATPINDYQAILQSINQLVIDAENELGTQGTLGIGMPGALSRVDGCLKNSNTICLNGKPVLQDLQTLLKRDISLSNDANCFALSEATDGNASGATVVFGVIIGTGTGGGIVIHGKVIDGVNAIAGEWGHNPLPWPSDKERPGPTCYCGKSGCIETFLSGPGMQHDYKIQTGSSLSAEEIVAKAGQGDEICQQTLENYYDRLARSLAHVINILDPEVIVLGGGMSNIPSLYQEVPERWGKYVFSDRVDTKIVAPKFGDSSGVRGAAWLGATRQCS